MLNIELLDACVLSENVFKEYIDKAKVKNIKLKKRFKVEKAFIKVDKIAFFQIIDNLLSNAIKYTSPNKSVSLMVNIIERKAIISVIDEGPGFTNEDKSKMFQKFSKLSAKPTGNETSAGIGLAIAKKLIDKMNAQLFLKTELGKGSTFEVIFELEKIME